MPNISSWLSDLSRRKLDVAASGRDGWRDTLNLRRFVLLKNSITQAETPLAFTNDSTAAPTSNTTQSITETSNVLASEEAWLESVLETLEEFDDQLQERLDAVDEDPLFEPQLDDPFECWIDDYAADDDPSPFSLSPDSYLPSSSSVLPSFQSPISFQYFLKSPEYPLNQSFVEPRYPEADFDLPLSDTSSTESDDEEDDDGPLTPFSGSQPSLRDEPVVSPQVYSEPDSYFLYPSELDLISVPPDFQHC